MERETPREGEIPKTQTGRRLAKGPEPKLQLEPWSALPIYLGLVIFGFFAAMALIGSSAEPWVAAIVGGAFIFGVVFCFAVATGGFQPDDRNRS